MTNESKRDWGNLFEPIDFCDKAESDRRDCLHGKGNDWCCGTTYSQIANEIIRKELEKAPKAYIDIDQNGKSLIGATWWGPTCTHAARLICIEEIKK